ncbi:hypothetical protein ABZ912_42555 [Nonomuraea angiospora]|uniref:hypothetical protein n=1 Tax=Nonomuraea angiospora TaxID=46172 RepID=UPI0033DBF38D
MNDDRPADDGRRRPTLAERLVVELDWLPGWVGRGPCSADAAAMYGRPGHAVEVCAGCRFLPACRAWVLGLHPALDPGGIVAGLSPTERAHARRGPQAAETTTRHEP